MEKGIYLLANDVVCDQLIALINSINVNYSPDIPICIIPFNEQVALIKEVIGKRKNTFLFEDRKSIDKWDLGISISRPCI